MLPNLTICGPWGKFSSFDYANKDAMPKQNLEFAFNNGKQELYMVMDLSD